MRCGTRLSSQLSISSSRNDWPPSGLPDEDPAAPVLPAFPASRPASPGPVPPAAPPLPAPPVVAPALDDVVPMLVDAPAAPVDARVVVDPLVELVVARVLEEVAPDPPPAPDSQSAAHSTSCRSSSPMSGAQRKAEPAPTVATRKSGAERFADAIVEILRAARPGSRGPDGFMSWGCAHGWRMRVGIRSRQSGQRRQGIDSTPTRDQIERTWALVGAPGYRGWTARHRRLAPTSQAPITNAASDAAPDLRSRAASLQEHPPIESLAAGPLVGTPPAPTVALVTLPEPAPPVRPPAAPPRSPPAPPRPPEDPPAPALPAPSPDPAEPPASALAASMAFASARASRRA